MRCSAVLASWKTSGRDGKRDIIAYTSSTCDVGDSVLDFSLAALVPLLLLQPSSLAGVTGAARERRFLTTTTVGCAAGGAGVPTGAGGPAGGAGVPTGAGGAPAGGRGRLLPPPSWAASLNERLPSPFFTEDDRLLRDVVAGAASFATTSPTAASAWLIQRCCALTGLGSAAVRGGEPPVAGCAAGGAEEMTAAGCAAGGGRKIRASPRPG